MRVVNQVRQTAIRTVDWLLSKSWFSPTHLGVVVFLSHAVVAMTHGGPVAVPDVSVYLSFSQWTFGGIPLEAPAFFPGYGLLLGPLGWMSGSGLHTAALLLNSALAAISLILAALLARSLGAGPKLEILVGILAAIHPAVSASSRIGWPETCLSLAVLLTCLAVQSEYWTRAGLIAGLSLTLHPRLMVLMFALVVTGLLHKRLKAVLAALIPSAITTALLLYWTDSWPADRISAAQSIGEGPSPFLTSIGQWLSLAAGTAGLASIGLFIAMRRIKTPSARPSETLLALSAVATLILGGWVLAGSDRIDTLLYGRYIDPWAIPLMVVGLVAVVNHWVTPKLACATVGSLVVALLIALSGLNQVHAPARRIMTLSLGWMWSAMNSNLTGVLLVASIVSTIGALGTIRGPTIALALLIPLSLTTTVLNHRHLNEVGKIAEGQVTVAALLPEGLSCLSHDRSVKSYALWLYRLERPEMHHQRIDLESNDQPCSNFVIADSDALSECSGAKYVADEPRGSWGLWEYPPDGCS